ncbi:MAG TPA: response regulator [Bacteroidales bacterium]|jgi:CheY-like chemotaxis protein|nr:response regulator [Bacteroidales bacterium]
MSVPNLQNKKILVVEDDEMSYLYLSQLLIIAKASFIREKTGAGAIQQFMDHSDFDIVLMDIQLPDMDGQSVTAEIRKLNQYVPIIAQTASRSVPELDQMLEAGCNALLIKPFSMEQFFEKLASLL